MTHRSGKGFTLIELLIVVAIIAILAAIAVPNFLEAQTRSKVSRVKADMRTTATALEAYYVDHNRYPTPHEHHNQLNWDSAASINEPPFHSKIGSMVTTPVAYLTSIPDDAFRTSTQLYPTGSYLNLVEKRFYYYNFPFFRVRFPGSFNPTSSNFGIAERLGGDWLFYSIGPDNDPWGRIPAPRPVTAGNARFVFHDYDPTNGTISSGNIFRTQKSGERLGPDPYYFQ